MRFVELLTEGSRQMPSACRRSRSTRSSYLRAIDRTGQGVARAIVPPPVAEAFAAVATAVAELPPEDPVVRGHRVYTRVCGVCHLPLRAIRSHQLAPARPASPAS
jgi:mono/diheme cytochrome c family protein